MKFRAYELEDTGRGDTCTDFDEDPRDACGADPELDLLESCSAAAPEPVPHDDRYTATLRKVFARISTEEVLAAEDAGGAERLYDALMSLPADRREPSIHEGDRFVSYALAERLLGASREVRSELPESSLELARLALAIADHLDSGRFGSGLVSDLRARSWAYLGELWSTASPAAAEEAFRLALGHLMQGSGDPLEEAEVLSLCAVATHDVEATLGRLEHAASIYRHVGDVRSLGEVLARKGRVAGAAGDHPQAVGLLREALELLADSASANFLSELSLDLAHHLVSSGQADEAWDEIARTRARLGRSDRPDDPTGLQLRLEWIEGRIAAALGLEEQARVRLSGARDGFLTSGRHRDAVRAHLDLAALSARSEGPAYESAMERLANETPRVLAGGDLPRESATALLLVEQAARRRALRPDLVSAVTALLESAA